MKRYRKIIFDPPNPPKFPYSIQRRLNMLLEQVRHDEDFSKNMPEVSEFGIRKSALRGQCNDRVRDAGFPWLRALLLTKRNYKSMFTPERLARIDELIRQVNDTCYSKLANCQIDLKTDQNKSMQKERKKKSWDDKDWKKHMEYISKIAGPKKLFEPPPVDRGTPMPLSVLQPRIADLAYLPEHKLYKRISQEDWYKNPTKVSPAALKYKITDNIKKMAVPKKVASAVDL